MELVTLAKETLQNVAENAASYRTGQTVLRHLDRMLWVVEKCAKWAVPPPLDQDDRPQPELIRPLPWVFFLMMLVTLRVVREAISLVNLVMGQPPVRSADMVMYIQSKRRYLRTLKYQGNRISRARTAPSPPQPSWYSSVRALFEVTMCFRRQPMSSNNNTDKANDNTERLIVKRSKRGRANSSPAVSAGETTMERLIEKMMVDLDADSDDDSSFTLTNVTSPKSDRSDFTVESDQETTYHNNTQPAQEETQSRKNETSDQKSEKKITNIQVDPKSTPKEEPKTNNANGHQIVSSKENTDKTEDVSKHNNNQSITPEKQTVITQKDTEVTQKEIPNTKKDSNAKEKVTDKQNDVAEEKETANINSKYQQHDDKTHGESKSTKQNNEESNQNEMKVVLSTTTITETEEIITTIRNETDKSRKDFGKRTKKALSTPEITTEPHTKVPVEKDSENNEIPKEIFCSPELTTAVSDHEKTIKFLQNETSSSKIPRNSTSEQKLANGRTAKSTPHKKRGSHGHGKETRNTAKGSSTYNM